MITYKKRIIKVVEIAPSVVQTRLQDFVEPYSYCGLAPTGSTEGESVWTITRIEVFMDGTISITTATNVAWVDRYTTVYN